MANAPEMTVAELIALLSEQPQGATVTVLVECGYVGEAIVGLASKKKRDEYGPGTVVLDTTGSTLRGSR